ncbi:unnamed protein product [Staurois parvus]|uniref:Phospholipase A1 member A n=1 Tax=Staurois parvus TaxID=386267 RepID=A0ABN9A9N4_9NEOB|nr:unnamed protein product [Staurois parvus]
MALTSPALDPRRAAPDRDGSQPHGHHTGSRSLISSLSHERVTREPRDMTTAGRGMAVLIASLITSITPTVLAQQAEPPIPAACGAFQVSGFFQDKKLEVQFLLYTPRNPTCAQVIHLNQSGGIESSTFNASLDTKIIIHGFRVLGTKPSWIENMVEALLSAGERIWWW